MLRHRRSDDLGAAAHGSGVCCVSPPRHLRAGVAAHSGGAAARRRSYVDSRFSLKQRPRLLRDGMASAQGFLSTWSLEPTAIPEEVDRVVCRLRHHARCLVLLQTGPRHQARGALALAPRTSRRTTALLHASHRSFCCARAGWLPVADDDGWGPLPFKAKESVSYYLSM